MSQTPSGSSAERAGRVLLSKRVPELLYGAVVAASVLAVSSAKVETGRSAAIATIAVALIYWLTRVYVDAVGGRFGDPDHPLHVRLLDAIRNNTEVLVGSLPPVGVFIIARLLGADVSTASLIALWFTVGLLTAAGGAAAFLAGVRGWSLVVERLSLPASGSW